MPHYTGHLAAASNRADLQFEVTVVDPNTNALVDLTGATIAVALRMVSRATPFLTGSNNDGHVTITGLGTFDVHFTRAEMTAFPAGDVDVGMTVLLANGITHQLIAGQLPIIDGVVAA